jgi:hypothetical protein
MTNPVKSWVYSKTDEELIEITRKRLETRARNAERSAEEKAAAEQAAAALVAADQDEPDEKLIERNIEYLRRLYLEALAAIRNVPDEDRTAL